MSLFGIAWRTIRQRLLTSGLTALSLALGVAGYQGAQHLVVLPQCRAACAEANQQFLWLYAGQRGPTRPAACVCTGDLRIETSGPDWMMFAAAVLGFGALWAFARLLPADEPPPG
jgi:hypothetical protein